MKYKRMNGNSMFIQHNHSQKQGDYFSFSRACNTFTFFISGP